MTSINTRGPAARDMDHKAEVDALLEQVGELASNMESVMAENAMLTKIVAGTDGAGALATIQRLGKEVAALRERVFGLQEEKNMAIRAAKLAQKAVKK